jgi:hypothetical protein
MTIKEQIQKDADDFFPGAKNNRGQEYYIAYTAFKQGAEWQASKMFSTEQLVQILEKFIEHPNKPGYKRSDVVAFIKQLKQQKDGKL